MFKASSCYLLLLTLIIVSGCAAPVAKPVRKMASVEPTLPRSSQQTWLYSWTQSPQALENPQAYINGSVAVAQSCLKKFEGAEYPLENCEGNGFAAGPGMYACDNPFTSHDYGTIVVITRSIPNRNDFSNYVARGRGADVMGRETYGDANSSAIVYDFRASDANTKAIVIRKTDILDMKQTIAVSVKKRNPRKFKDHPSYVCDAKTSVVDVLKNWGDQMEFMSITFFSGFNHSLEPFAKDGKLNPIAYAAAIASDAVTIANFEKVFAGLVQKHSLEESLGSSACSETSTNSKQSCLAMRIFDSFQENFGHGDSWRYAFRYPELRKILVDLGVLKHTEAADIQSASELMIYLANRTKRNSVEDQRIREAYHCMEVVREQNRANHLALWAQQPE